MLLTKIIVKYPFIVVILMLVVPFLGVAILRNQFKFSPERGGSDIFDVRTRNLHATSEAEKWGNRELLNLLEDPSFAAAAKLPKFDTVQGAPTFFLSSVYIRRDDGNILEDAQLSKIHKVELQIMEHRNFSKFCVLDETGNCTRGPNFPFRTLLNYVYRPQLANGTWGPPDGTGKSARPIKDVLDDICGAGGEIIDEDVKFFFDKNFTCANRKSVMTRSLMLFGAPLCLEADRADLCFAKANEREEEQSTLVGNFFLDLEPAFGDINDDEFEMLYLASGLLENFFVRVLVEDGKRAVISAAFVFLYIALHTRSPFIAGFGALHIILSFPLAFLFYKNVFRIQEFFGLNFLALFIILAIGADDIFVFMDAWRQSACEPDCCGSLETRMEWVWKRAAKAMFITSFTTVSAFLATSVSPLPTVSAFGLFAAMLVFFNYVFVISYFPAIVVIYHKYLEKRRVCCCMCKGAQDDPCCHFDANGRRCAKPATVPMQRRGSVAHPNMGKVEKFFFYTYASVMSKRKVQVAVLIGFALLLALFVPFAAQIRPSTTATQFLPSSHPLQRIFDASADFTATTNEDWEKVTLLYGVTDIDQTGLSKYDITERTRGTVQWDNSFNAASTTTQELILSTCVLATGNPQLVTSAQSKCPLVSFREWLSSPDSVFMRQGLRFMLKSKLPDAQASLLDYLDTLASCSVDAPCYPVDEHVFPFLFFTWFGLNMMDFRGKVGFEGSIPSLTDATVTDAMDELAGLRVKYIIDTFNSTIRADLFYAATEVRPAYQLWEVFTTAANSAAGAPHAIMASSKWVFMNTQEIYISSALSGGGLSIGAAFLVLLFSTGNIIIAGAATFSIAGVVVCIIGLMVMLGWELGSIESICCTVLVGLSVDYVVHLANSYIESDRFRSRVDRTQDALGEMGVTVVGGAVTSVGASLILFTCQIQFFYKFGFFMCFTCFFAWLWSLGLFIALCQVLGPVNNFGQFLYRHKLSTVTPTTIISDTPSPP